MIVMRIIVIWFYSRFNFVFTLIISMLNLFVNVYYYAAVIFSSKQSLCGFDLCNDNV